MVEPMAVTKVTCPECEAVLKLAKPVSPGRSIRCPECGVSFVVPDDETPASPRPKGPPRPEDAAKKATAKQGGVKKVGKEKTRRQGVQKARQGEKAPAPAPRRQPSDDDDDEGAGA